MQVSETVTNEERRKIFFDSFYRMRKIDAECMLLAEKDEYDKISRLEDEQRHLLIRCMYVNQYCHIVDDAIDKYMHWKVNTLY